MIKDSEEKQIQKLREDELIKIQVLKDEEKRALA